MSARRLPLLLVAFLAACGGTSNEVHGSYKGQSLDVSDATLMPVQGNDGSEVSVVVFETESNACGFLQSRAVNNSRLVTVALAIVSPEGMLVPPTAAGSYEIAAPRFLKAGTKLAAVHFGVFGACGDGTGGDAVSGSVHVTHVQLDGAEVVQSLAGTFEATFDTGEKFSGNFQVSRCAGARIIYGLCR